MTFESTRDMQLVKEIFTHPKVYPYITDDGSAPAAEFIPLDHPAILYLLCMDGEELLGLWMFVRSNAVTVEVHTCLLPGHGFRRARTAAREAAEWIWANTDAMRIVTTVPAFNRAARWFAEAAGMTQYGLNPQSFLKDGILHDQALLGLSRPCWLPKDATCDHL